MRYIVDGVFSAPGIHLVAGASGCGKTSWLLDTFVNEWERGNPVLGFNSHPEPWVYISGDRSEEGVWKRADALRISRERIPLIPAYATKEGFLGEERLIELALNRGAKTLVWEGFGRYVGDNARGSKVDRWLEWMTAVSTRMGLCIIGVVEQPKMKPKDKYPIPRQRVSGPAAWGHHTDTIVLIEFEDEKNPANPGRLLYLLSHDSKPMVFRASMESGKFVVLELP